MTGDFRQLEARFERLLLDNQDLRRKLTQALQQIRDLQAKPAALSGLTTAVYEAVSPGGGIAAASAGPGGGTPGMASCTVYKLVSGAYVSIGTADVYNPYLDAVGASKVITVGPNGDGSYTVLGESCT